MHLSNQKQLHFLTISNSPCYTEYQQKDLIYHFLIQTVIHVQYCTLFLDSSSWTKDVFPYSYSI